MTVSGLLCPGDSCTTSFKCAPSLQGGCATAAPEPCGHKCPVSAPTLWEVSSLGLVSAKAGQEQDETEEPTVEQGPRCLPENLIEEGFDPKVQPRTLLDILKQTLNNPKHKDKPIWDLGEEGSLGERACLMRVQMLQKALRHFVK